MPETELSVEFPAMLHGWVVRGDPNMEDVRREQERALKLTVKFIETHHPAGVDRLFLVTCIVVAGRTNG
jgi:hypothetical protein